MDPVVRIIYSNNGLTPDFVRLCRELDDFMLRHPNVDQSAYVPYGEQEHIRDAFVAYRDGKAVGCAAFRWPEDNVAELKRVYVKKEHRRAGISRLLLNAVLKEAKQQGCRVITLGTLLTLEAAVSLYHSYGFHNIEINGLYVQMEKTL